MEAKTTVHPTQVHFQIEFDEETDAEALRNWIGWIDLTDTRKHLDAFEGLNIYGWSVHDYGAILLIVEYEHWQGVGSEWMLNVVKVCHKLLALAIRESE